MANYSYTTAPPADWWPCLEHTWTRLQTGRDVMSHALYAWVCTTCNVMVYADNVQPPAPEPPKQAPSPEHIAAGKLLANALEESAVQRRIRIMQARKLGERIASHSRECGCPTCYAVRFEEAHQ